MSWYAVGAISGFLGTRGVRRKRIFKDSKRTLCIRGYFLLYCRSQLMAVMPPDKRGGVFFWMRRLTACHDNVTSKRIAGPLGFCLAKL